LEVGFVRIEATSTGAAPGAVRVDYGGSTIIDTESTPPDAVETWSLSSSQPLGRLDATAFTVSGLRRSSNRADVQLHITYEHPAGQSIAEDVIGISVVEVQEVFWEGIDPGDGLTNLFDDNPLTHGDGYRFYAEKNFPGTPLHEQVNLRARLNVDVPSLWILPVHFKTFDVDDPTQNWPGYSGTNKVDTNDSFNNYVGDDNRPSPGGMMPSGVVAATVNAADGCAGVLCSVTARYAGNNWRAVAFCAEPRVLDTQLDTTPIRKGLGFVFGSSGTGVPGANTSALLSIWRTVNIETDAMLRPTFTQNTVTGNWQNPIPFGSTQFFIEVDSSGQEWEFDGGLIRLTSPGFSDLLCSVIVYEDNWPGWDTVRVDVGAGGLGGRTAGSFTMSDDDLTVNATFNAGVYGCDLGTGSAHLPLLNVGSLSSVYATCYISVQTWPSETDTTVPFEQHVSDWLAAKAFWDICRPFRGLPTGSADFWTAYFTDSGSDTVIECLYSSC
jgi:hypothetical protein